MKKGLLLVSLLTLLFSTTSCNYLVRNIDDLLRLGSNLIDVPPLLYKNLTDQLTDDEKSTIKLEYYDTSYHKPTYNIPAISPDTKITVPNIPSVNDIKKNTPPIRYDRSGSSTNLVLSRRYAKCLYCNGLGKFGGSTCTHCYGIGKVLIPN